MTPANPDFAAAVRANLACQGLMRTLGASLDGIEPGRVTIEMPAGPAATQRMGVMHGGAIAAIAETAGACAALSLMPVGRAAATVDYKINFVAPAMGRRLRATANVVRAGRTATFVRIEVESGGAGEFVLCAVLQATYLAVAADAGVGEPEA